MSAVALRELMLAALRGEPLGPEQIADLTVEERGELVEAQRKALRRMTHEQRMLAYRRGALSRVQWLEWDRVDPRGVPRVNGEHAYIALKMADLDPD